MRWPEVPLGSILRLRKDVIHPRDQPTGLLPFVGLEHVEQGTGVRLGSIDTDLSMLTGRKPRFYRGDIVYGYLRPYLNKVWVAQFDGICSVDQYVYHVLPEAEAEYVAAFMRSPIYLERAPIDRTPGQLPRIRTEEVAAVPIPLPPLAEQRRIATRLGEALAAVERARVAARAQLESARLLPAALLRSLFEDYDAENWPVVPLGSVGAIRSGITLGRKLNGQPTHSVPYLRVANVKDGYLDLTEVKEIEATLEERERFRLSLGDLLLTEGGDPDKLGRGTFWQEEIHGCIHQNHIFRVRFDVDRFDPRFLAAQLGSDYGKRYFFAHAKQTTGIATINQKVLSAFPLLTPPVSVQRSLAEKLATKAAQSVLLSQLIDHQLDQLKSTTSNILSHAFAGNL